MAKDPAFLFYASDFLSGTMFFSDEQTGKYIKLICAQKLTGHLSYEDMMQICKTHDKHIFAKYVQDKDGLYYNEVLDWHIEKRAKYSESRANNRRKYQKEAIINTDNQSITDKKNISKTYLKDMENENENVIVNINVNATEKVTKKAQQILDNVAAIEARFIIDVLDFSGDYSDNMLQAFIRYWTERNPAKTKIKYMIELEKKGTFEIGKRLVTWAGKNYNDNPKSGGVGPKKTSEDKHNDILKDYE